MELGRIKGIESEDYGRKSAHVFSDNATHNRRPAGRWWRTCGQGIVATEFNCELFNVNFVSKFDNSIQINANTSTTRSVSTAMLSAAGYNWSWGKIMIFIQELKIIIWQLKQVRLGTSWCITQTWRQANIKIQTNRTVCSSRPRPIKRDRWFIIKMVWIDNSLMLTFALSRHNFGCVWLDTNRK